MSPEAEKITAIQITTGSQYLTNDFSFDTAHRKPGAKTLRNAKGGCNSTLERVRCTPPHFVLVIVLALGGKTENEDEHDDEDDFPGSPLDLSDAATGIQLDPRLEPLFTGAR